MRTHAFTLTLALGLAACQGDPTAPDPSPLLSGQMFGSGARGDTTTPSTSSAYGGSGHRAFGGGSTIGSGPRDGEDGPATASSGFVGSGFRGEQEAQDSPYMGGSNGE